MDKPINIVILPMHDWKKFETEGFRTRDAHLTLEFAKDPRVGKILFVDRPVSLAEHLVKKRPWKVATGKCVSEGPNSWLTQVEEKIFVLDIRVMDVLSPIIRKRAWWHDIFQRNAIHRSIREALQFLKIDHHVLFLWSPLSTGVHGKLGSDQMVFDALDNWARHPEMTDSRDEIVAGYEAIKQNADFIFVNSKELETYLGGGKSEVEFIPNGVHPHLFAPRAGDAPPADLQALPKPWIGYAGKLAKRIDVDLVTHIAKSNPEASFVFIGQVLDNNWIAPLRQIPNIHFLGDKHYSVMPDYVRAFDVCLIPHNVGKLENGGDPIKLYEYLAAGKPIVTTPIAGVDVFSDVISICSTPDGFDEALKAYLRKSPEEMARLSDLLIARLPESCHWSYKGRHIVDRLLKLSETRKVAKAQV